MKIIGRSKSPNRPQKKRKSFPAAVSELAEKDGLNAKVIIYERAGMKGKYIDQIPILDAVEIAGDIEAALSREHGGGEYQLSLVNSDSELVENHQYSISGPPKGRERFGDDTGEFNKGMRGRGLSDEMALRAFDAAIARQASSGEEFKTGLQVMKELRAEDSGMKQVQIDFMNAAMQNALNPKNTTIEEHLRVMQLLKEVQPTLPPEDPMNAIIPGVVSLIGQLVQAKIGGGAQPNPGQLQQVQELLKSQGVDVNPLLQQAGQAQLAQLGQTVPVPGPGEPAQAPPVAQDTVPSTPRASSLDVMLVEFREDVAADAQIPRLALALHQMVAKAEYMAGIGAPHPMFAGLINQTDPVRLSHEFDRFTAAIPEFKQKPDSAAAIKAAIAASYMPQPEPEVEPQQPPGEPTQPAQVQQVAREQRDVTEEPNITGPMIDQFRLNITAGASPKQIALQIIELVRTAEIWTPDNVPPILQGLVNQNDLVRLENELTRFFGAIPELASNEELKSQIKLEFIKMLSQVDVQEQPDQENGADEKEAAQEKSPAEPPAASNK